MSIISSVTTQVELSGDITEHIIQSTLDNAVSPAKSDVVSLALGANTITAPVISGLVVTGLLIIPPSGNTALMTLKGVTGDTGIPLHLTNHTFLSLDTTFVSLVLNAAAAVVGVRLIWT